MARLTPQDLERLTAREEDWTVVAATVSTKQFAIAYSMHGDHLLIDGPLRGDTVHILLRRLDPAQFRILRPGFHWVTE